MAQFDRLAKDVRQHLKIIEQLIVDFEQGAAPTNGVAKLKMSDEATAESVGTANADANSKAQELLAKGKDLTQQDLDGVILSPDLKAMCKSLGLTQSAKKADVITKILAKIKSG